MVRFVDSEDESVVGTDDGLAPVTPIFGGAAAVPSYPKTAAEARRALEERMPAARVSAPVPPSTVAGRRKESDDDPDPGERTAADPRPVDLVAARAERADSSSGSRSGERGRSRGARSSEQKDAEADAGAAAERGLLKRLRARQLSVSEARAYLGRHELGAGSIGRILDAFLARGYLDDARLAEQLVYAGADRKGQGRQVIAQSLARRGVPREVADAALMELPDDDAERALEFARAKANALRGVERDVALRRLAGQLARRGYGGSVALNAARTALDETARPTGGVRFEER